MPDRTVHPEPPLHRFRHGAVWRVMLERTLSRNSRRTWKEVWDGDPQPREYRVLLTDPNYDWPEHPLHYWRSRLVVGNLAKRKEEDIYKDFRRLLIQTPPVLRNWRKNLSEANVDGHKWHLVWVDEVASVL